MTSSIEPLILDLVEWVATARRSYAEVMEAWRTSCPRLTVWEDAVDRDLVRRELTVDGTIIVVATDLGIRMLGESGRPIPSSAPRSEWIPSA
jgi:hypothetical protein